jgi:hypothetical protein
LERAIKGYAIDVWGLFSLRDDIGDGKIGIGFAIFDGLEL